MGTRRDDTPLGAIFKGAMAGIVGTVAMDLVWYSRYRRDGGEQSMTDWEFSSELEGYEDAPAPAQVGKRLIEALFDTELDPETAAPMNNAVHWATGAGWGALHGIVNGSAAKPSALAGLVTGAVAWVTSYLALAPAGLYKPMWEYDAETLWNDLSAHLAFGIGTGFAYKLLASSTEE